jgi:hypothetical protein
MRAFVMALALALALAGPAAAAKFVFDVTVTGVQPGGDFDGAYVRVESGIIPAPFQLTFTASGPFATGSYTPGYGNGGSVDAAATSTPLTPEVMAAAGVSGPPDYISIGLNRNSRGFDSLYMSSAIQIFDVAGGELVGQHDYFMGLYARVRSAPHSDLIPYNYVTLDLFLRQVGVIGFQEYGDNWLFDQPGHLDRILYSSYVGTATYRPDLSDAGAVPEPSTWALMIGGFGLAGAALRRRRALASA